MKKILLVELNRGFIDDINRSLLINERNDLYFTDINDPSKVESCLRNERYDMVLIYASFVSTRYWDIGIPVRSYARKEEEVEASLAAGIKCYGVINRTSALFSCIEKDDLTKDGLSSTYNDTEGTTNILTADDLPNQFSDWQSNAPTTPSGRRDFETIPLSEEQDNSPKVTDYVSQTADTNTVTETDNPQNYQQSYQQGYQQQPVQQNYNQYEQQSYSAPQYQQQTEQSQYAGYNQYQQTPQQQSGYDAYGSQNMNQFYQQGLYQQTPYQNFQAPAPVQQKSYSYTPSYEGQPVAYYEPGTNYPVYEIVQIPSQQPKWSYYPTYVGQHPKFIDANGRPLYEIIQAIDVQDVQIMDEPSPTGNISQGPSNVIPNQPNVPNVPTPNTPSTSAQPKVTTAPSSSSSSASLNPNNILTEDMAPEQPKNDTPQPNEVQKLQYKVTDRFKQNRAEELKAAGEQADLELAQEFNRTPQKAKCITVYSAKGGVGKTTISCELASLLALTKHNRGHYKVCVADFNIDFGDVMSTLAFDPNGANMTTWAQDIAMRIERGEKPEDITYTDKQISVWLQQDVATGLYALLAPTSNVDSMDIHDDAIKVMMDNLINNGGFDFVICDTGNNTRDSSFIALQEADAVLLVITQDVNTANCNTSFLHTAEDLDFDMSKINLVINLVRPGKLVGIQPEELESVFRDKSGRPYRFKTLAKIKHNNEVVYYGNEGKPLIFNTSHEFTHSIGEIARNFTNQEPILVAPKKEKLFDKMFKKK